MPARWGKRVLLALAVLLGVALLTAGTVVGLTERTLRRRYQVTPASIVIPTDSAALARGRHLATAIGKCVDCHGEDLGGIAREMGPLGRYTAPNLTSGKGGVGLRSDADWVRAIRHGISPDGKPLVFMPSGVFSHLSAEDLGALIAWIRSVPPVDRELPPRQVGPIGRLVIATSPERLVAATVVDHERPIPAAVPPGPTAEYGAYLVSVGGCQFCHRESLRGGQEDGPPGTPPSADLTTAGPLGSWSEADFRNALRTGIRPDGSTINPFMPWRLTRLMTDEEITAVWAYLRTR